MTFEVNVKKVPTQQVVSLTRRVKVHKLDATISESEYMTSAHCQAKDCSKAHSTLIADWEGKNSPSQSRREEVVEYLKNPSTFTRGGR